MSAPRRPRLHLVPTAVEVVPGADGRTLTLKFDTDEGVPVSLYLPADVERELRARLGGRPMDEAHPIDRGAARRGFTE